MGTVLYRFPSFFFREGAAAFEEPLCLFFCMRGFVGYADGPGMFRGAGSRLAPEVVITGSRFRGSMDEIASPT
jgi:hypothetical protein